ncbi:MAG: tetratricopeptide repeat protein [Fretibacterium sp.]|nr:tetratricopeptide repeat protein [Fretibacterium sp.]
MKKTAAKPAPKPAPVSALDRGIAFMKQERYSAAQPWLQRAVQQNRRSAAAWYWYGMCHEKTGRFYEAQYFYSKAVECDPTFEPLSRVVTYPNGGDKTPLWDPRRPARVYPVPTDNVMGTPGRSVTIIPPDSPQARKRPSRPAPDPELPRVPAYIPPEPGAMPQDGDAWHPAVYVPPTMNSIVPGRDEETPVYVPPSIPGGGTPAVSPVTADPVYQPPQPAPRAAAVQPASKPQKAAAVKPAPRKKAVKKRSSSRKAAPKKPAAAAQPTVKAQEPPAPPKEETPPKPQPETPPKRGLEYLPPVGQVPQDRLETRPLPPVGQKESVEKETPPQQSQPSEEDNGNA